MTVVRFDNNAIEPVTFPGKPTLVGSWVMLVDESGVQVILPEGRVRSITWDGEE